MAGADITGGLHLLRATLLVAAGIGCATLPAVAAPPRTVSVTPPQRGNLDRSVSQEVVQQLPANDSLSLNTALAQLGRNPRDVEALIAAGKAALAMGDTDAAVGFFSRADQISPANPRVKAGLAGALVRNENPLDAIPLFEEAERGGALDGSQAADRGLAYDLVGDNATAQRFYRQVLGRGPNDEATRRLALSLAISGDRRGAETTLAPLLARRDKSAFRARAFALAIAGDVEGAASIANATLPQGMAVRISPYLRYMPRLTRAQQAAAASFGHFPRASEIGRDDPRITRYTAAADAAAQVAKTGSLGGATQARSKSTRSTKNVGTAVATRQAPTAPPEAPQVSREVLLPGIGSKAAAASKPQRSAGTSPGAVTPAQARRGPAVVALPATPPLTQPAASRTVMGPVFAGGDVPRSSVGASTAQPASKPPISAPGTRTSNAAADPLRPSPATRPSSVADAFRDLTRPAPNAAPAAGAVDIRSITPARARPKEAAKPAKPILPSHPSRIWVQLAMGRNKDALSFDWRRMARGAPEQFRGKKPNVSTSGQNNRLLAGPFPSVAAATAFIAQLRRANVDGAFVWTSPAGQVVDALTTP